MTDSSNSESKKRTRKNDFFFRDDQPPPHDISLEKALLGAILLEEESRNIAIDKISSPNIFYYPSHQRIFIAIRKLYEAGDSGIDIFSVANQLNSEKVLTNIGGEEYLLELQNSIATTANLEKWCEILNDYSALRKMISVCATTINQCYDADTENIANILGDIESSIFEVRNTNKTTGATKVSEHILGAVKHLENLHSKDMDATGISTGLPNLDNIIVGLRKQEMIVIAARPSIGKTALALNIASHIALDKKKSVAFFSLEMSSEQLTRRLLCSLAKISEKDFYEKRFDEQEFGRRWSDVTKAANQLKHADIYIDPTPSLSINELKAKALRLKSKHDIDIVIIDYLQLMQADIGRNDNRQVEVAKISVGVKALAKELDVPVVVLAQLNRQAEQQDRPKLSHLRESGAIEQDADIVMFLHRERDTQKDISQESIEAELIIEKNRNGQTGIAKLLFFPKITTFRCPARDKDAY
ncbi:MAG: replicative DNA helicase [bacterium]|nr:replicative DNA helicase [bacterium]